MEFKTVIDEDELTKISNLYDCIEDNFKESVMINSKFKKKIENAYSLALLNIARADLSLFHLKYLEMFESLAGHYRYNEEMYELSDSLTRFIDSYFKKLNDNMDIKNMDDLNEVLFILKISSICIEAVLEDMDIELAYEVFFNIDRHVNKKNLMKSKPLSADSDLEYMAFKGNVGKL